MTTYKVWLYVERIDDDFDDYEDVGLPDSLGEFGSLQEADAFCLNLLAKHNPTMIASSDRGNAICRALYTSRYVTSMETAECG